MFLKFQLPAQSLYSKLHDVFKSFLRITSGKPGKTLCYNRDRALSLQVEPSTFDKTELGRAFSQHPKVVKDLAEKKLSNHAHVYCTFSSDFQHDTSINQDWIPLGFQRTKFKSEYIPIIEVKSSVVLLHEHIMIFLAACEIPFLWNTLAPGEESVQLVCEISAHSQDGRSD